MSLCIVMAANVCINSGSFKESVRLQTRAFLAALALRDHELGVIVER
jgi:citrate lyase alpha subunit